MNKIFFFIFILYFNFISFSTYPNNIRITNIELSHYPEIKITFNLPFQDTKVPFSINVFENDSLVNIKSLYKKKPDNSTAKSMLILIEDMTEKTHPGQRKFIKKVLEETINKLVNKKDKVNIALFNRSQKETSMIQPLLKNYTDNITLLRNAIINYKSKNNIFYQQLSSDLYYAVFDGLNELAKKFPKDNKVLLLFSAGKNNMKSQEVVPDRSIQFSREYRIPVFSVQYYIPGWEHNRITSLIYGTGGKEVVTNNIRTASDSLQSFLKNVSTVIQGQTYTITYISPFKKNGEIRHVKLLINNIPIIFQYVSPSMNIKDYVKLILSNPKYCVSIVIILLALIYLFFLLFTSKKKNKDESKRIIKNLESKEELNKRILNDYQNKLSKIEKSLKEKQKRKSITEILKEKNLHGIYPRLIYKVNNEPKVFPLSKQKISIGRSTVNDVIIDDGLVSRTHCVIVFDGESFSIVDKDSSNGTFVNNLKIMNQKLKHGDQIKIGSTEMAYVE